MRGIYNFFCFVIIHKSFTNNATYCNTPIIIRFIDLFKLVLGIDKKLSLTCYLLVQKYQLTCMELNKIVICDNRN